ncbi:MAG: hypothetical protein ACT4OI_08855 [Methanobacteriota archaeon]
MDENLPRTEFVRRSVLERPFGPDLAYTHDLLELERFLASSPPGMAGSLALQHLMSRYPREADAIVRELGVRPFAPLEEARVAALVEERLSLAERRHPLGRRLPTDPPGLLEW